MNQQQSPAPNQPPSRGSSIILWIGIGGFLAAFILGIYTLVAKQDIAFSIISFVLAALSIPLNILQVAPNILQQARQTLKMGLSVIGILLLFGSLGMNGYLLIRPLPYHPISNPSPAFSTPTSTAIPSPTSTSTSLPLPPPALVQQNISPLGSTTLNAVQFRNPVKAGDLIVVAITQDETTIIGTPTDNLSNSYTPVRTGPALFADLTNQHDYVELYYAKNVTGGDTTVTVTFTTPVDSNSGDSNVGIYEFSGLDKTSPLGPVAFQPGSGNMPDGGTLTTTQDNEVIFVVGVDSGLDNQKDPNINKPASSGKGYLLLPQHEDSVNYERFYTEYQIAVPGTHNADFSLKYLSNWAVIGAIFKG